MHSIRCTNCYRQFTCVDNYHRHLPWQFRRVPHGHPLVTCDRCGRQVAGRLARHQRSALCRRLSQFVTEFALSESSDNSQDQASFEEPVPSSTFVLLSSEVATRSIEYFGLDEDELTSEVEDQPLVASPPIIDLTFPRDGSSDEALVDANADFGINHRNEEDEEEKEDEEVEEEEEGEEGDDPRDKGYRGPVSV